MEECLAEALDLLLLTGKFFKKIWCFCELHRYDRVVVFPSHPM